MDAPSDAAGNTYVAWVTAPSVYGGSEASSVFAAVRHAGHPFLGRYAAILV